MPIPENLWSREWGEGGKEELFSLSPSSLQKSIAFVAQGKHQDAQIS